MFNNAKILQESCCSTFSCKTYRHLYREVKGNLTWKNIFFTKVINVPTAVKVTNTARAISIDEVSHWLIISPRSGVRKKKKLVIHTVLTVPQS